LAHAKGEPAFHRSGDGRLDASDHVAVPWRSELLGIPGFRTDAWDIIPMMGMVSQHKNLLISQESAFLEYKGTVRPLDGA
jgi:hypothetical protein